MSRIVYEPPINRIHLLQVISQHIVHADTKVRLIQSNKKLRIVFERGKDRVTYSTTSVSVDSKHGPYCAKYKTIDGVRVYCGELKEHSGPHEFVRAI